MNCQSGCRPRAKTCQALFSYMNQRGKIPKRNSQSQIFQKICNRTMPLSSCYLILNEAKKSILTCSSSASYLFGYHQHGPNANVYASSPSYNYKIAYANYLRSQAPGQDCWPSLGKWDSLNDTIHGALILNEPVAKSCYPPSTTSDTPDTVACDDITSRFAGPKATWRKQHPIGYMYPLIETCSPITLPNDTSAAAYPPCDLGNYPVYTINATSDNDVAAGIKFAKENNIRLTVKNTGHDIRHRQDYADILMGYHLMIFLFQIRRIRQPQHLDSTYQRSHVISRQF